MTSVESTLPMVSWLVMLYIAADDIPNLENPGTGGCGEAFGKVEDTSILDDICVQMLDRIENVDLADNVRIVVLYDDSRRIAERKYYPAALTRTQGQLAWEDRTASIDKEENIFYLREDGKQEINSGHYLTLGRYIRWALRHYPAEKTMLAIIGHGGGWAPTLPFINPSGETIPFDHDNQLNDSEWQKKGPNNSPGMNGICVDYSSCTAISTMQLRLAFEYGLEDRRNPDQNPKLDVVFLDACLMAMVEVAYEVRNCVDYLVAGENLLSAALPYEDYLRASHLSARTTPVQLASSIVRLYNKNVKQKPWTIGAFSTRRLDVLRSSIDSLAHELVRAVELSISRSDHVEDRIRNVYGAVQKFDYDGDAQIRPTIEGYVDLFSFAFNLWDTLPGGNYPPDWDDELIGHVNNARNKAAEIIGLLSNNRQAKVRQRWPSRLEAIFQNSIQILQNSIQTEPIIVAFKPSIPDRDMDLRAAEGLSIYLPLGEKEDRNTINNATIKKLLGGESQLYFYANQLLFTQKPEESSYLWADLLNLLTSNTSSGWRDDPANYYRTPRQRAL